MAQDTWLCPKCAAGAALPPPRAEPRTAREKLMAGTLGLVRIVAIWHEADGSLWFTGRWYILPEEAHTGRQVGPLPLQKHKDIGKMLGRRW